MPARGWRTPSNSSAAHTNLLGLNRVNKGTPRSSRHEDGEAPPSGGAGRSQCPRGGYGHPAGNGAETAMGPTEPADPNKPPAVRVQLRRGPFFFAPAELGAVSERHRV